MDTTTTNMNVLCRRVPLVRSLTHSWLAHSMRHMRDHWARTNARLANILHPLRHLELGITAPLSQWPAAQHKNLSASVSVCVYFVRLCWWKTQRLHHSRAIFQSVCIFGHLCVCVRSCDLASSCICFCRVPLTHKRVYLITAHM